MIQINTLRHIDLRTISYPGTGILVYLSLPCKQTEQAYYIIGKLSLMDLFSKAQSLRAKTTFPQNFNKGSYSFIMLIYDFTPKSMEVSGIVSQDHQGWIRSLYMV